MKEEMKNKDLFGTGKLTKNWERQNRELVRNLTSLTLQTDKLQQDNRRQFNKSEQNHIRERQGGKCAHCRKILISAVHYDHIKPFEDGGKTDISNGQALCPNCHSIKTNEDRLKKQRKKRVMKTQHGFWGI